MKDRIKQIMEAQHMTQQVFAEFIGTTPATLSGIFNDRTRPTINIVEAIKKKMPAINTDWLLFGNGTMFKTTEGVDQTASGANAGASDDTPARHREGSLFDQNEMLDLGVSYAEPKRDVEPKRVVVERQQRRVTEIRVYYDDQTWESFVPTKK